MDAFCYDFQAVSNAAEKIKWDEPETGQLHLPGARVTHCCTAFASANSGAAQAGAVECTLQGFGRAMSNCLLKLSYSSDQRKKHASLQALWVLVVGRRLSLNFVCRHGSTPAHSVGFYGSSIALSTIELVPSLFKKPAYVPEHTNTLSCPLSYLVGC